MMRIDMRLILISIVMILSLSACNEDASEQQLAQKPQAIGHEDVCHLCGMTINNFPGPKGELYERGNSNILKFGSTSDLFAYLLDPEHSHAIESVFVHDMGMTSWEHPDDKAFINARTAWYVVGSNRKGEMGPTLVSFGDRQLANVFTEQYGGKVHSFDEINQQLLLEMN